MDYQFVIILKIYQIVDDVNNNRFSNETIKERIADINLSALPYEDYKTTLVFWKKLKMIYYSNV